MKVIVKPHKIKIELEHDYNSGEYNVQECNFEFSDEYTGLSKVVIFSNSNVTKEIQIYDDKCIVPAEVLQNEGVVGIGVYGYEVSGDELTLRYSPKPQCFSVEKGSYAEGTQPTPPTPSVVEQLQQQITNNANNISSLQDLTASQGEQIETNANDISAIKSEQTTQNNKIQANTEEIESINEIIPTLAKKTEIPTKVSQLENDSNYVTETEMSNEINEEKAERENADIELQSQIDAITVSSDVVDVVGTYQELLGYDTSKLTDDDIIKVLVDSTHNDALSYYRWQITGGIGSWEYVGSEGPFYTKSETDSLLNEKQDEITNDNKLDSDLVSDDGQTNKFVTVQEKNNWNNKQDALTFDNTPTENSNNPVKSGGIYDFVNTKLEDYVLETDFEESQSLQDDEIERANMIYNAMPKVSGEGTDLTLDNTAKCPVYDVELSPSELEQETTSGKNKLPILDGTITANGITITVENGVININGTSTAGTNFKLTNGLASSNNFNNDWLEETAVADKNNTTLSINYVSGSGATTNCAFRVYGESSSYLNQHYPTETLWNTTYSEIGKISCVAFFTQSGRTFDNYKFTIQDEDGSTVTDFEKFTYGASPNPQYPQEIHTVSGDNTITIENKNIMNTDELYQEMYDHNSSGLSKEVIDNKNCIKFNSSRYTNAELYKKNYKENTSYTFRFLARIDDTSFTSGHQLFFRVNYTDGTRSSISVPANGTTWQELRIVSTLNKTVSFISFSFGTGAYWLIDEDSFNIIEGDTTDYVKHKEQSLPLSLGDLEYCKIGDYEDLFFKNVIGSEYYDSTLELDKWYLKKNIGKVVLDGSENWHSTSAVEDNTKKAYYLNASNIDNYKQERLIKYSNYYRYEQVNWKNANSPCIAENTNTGNMLLFRNDDIISLTDWKNWLTTHNTIVYYVLATPTNTLLSDTLQTQLDNIQKTITYQDQTNVSQTNADLPFVIKLSAIRDLSGIFELIQ